MAVDIDVFKRDLDQLKNQRSVIQAKLDEANRHIASLTETLKGMGFNSVEEAKQSYVRQIAEAESQHEQVKRLIAEISQVDSKLPTREEVMARLSSLSMGEVNKTDINVVNPAVEQAPVVEQTVGVNDFIQNNVIPPTTQAHVDVGSQGDKTVDLSSMLFESLL